MQEARRASGLGSGVVLTLLTALTVGAAASAEPPANTESVDEAPIVRELSGIRAELRAIARLLGSLEAQQRASVSMTRIQLKQQRLTSIEGQIRSARDEIEGAEQEIERMSVIEASYADERGRVDEPQAEDMRREIELVRQRKKALGTRVEVLRSRILELENDLAGLQKEIRALEEAVDEELGAR